LVHCVTNTFHQRRRKLDHKSEPIIFVGYNSIGSYKLYNPETKQVSFGKDVHFDESNSCSEFKSGTIQV